MESELEFIDDDELNLQQRKKLKTIKSLIKKETPTIQRILDCNISDNQKAICLKMFNKYKQMDDTNEDKDVLRENIMRMLKENISFEKNIIDSYKERLSLLDVNEDIRKFIGEKINDCIVKNANERKERFDWINNVLNLPYNRTKQLVPDTKDSTIRAFLQRVKERLDERMYGLQDVKLHILKYVCTLIISPKNCGNLALLSPPGYGKNEFVSALSYALDLPYREFSLGGSTDSILFKGGSRIWMNSEPSSILQTLQSTGISNPIIYFDEVDKISNSDRGYEVMNSLLHLIDKTSNNKCSDDYINQFPHDFSRIMFVLGMNSTDGFSTAFLNRLRIIKIPRYSMQDKKIIVRDYIMKKKTKELECDAKFSEEALNHLVNTLSPNDEGIRILRDACTDIISSILYDKILGKIKYPFVIDCDYIDKLKLVRKNEILDMMII